MKHKYNLKGFLTRILPVYLVVTTCFSIGIVYILNLKTALKREEIFNVFIGVDTVNYQNLKTNIKNSIPEIKEVNIYTTDTNSSTVFINDLSTKGLVSSDLLILPNEMLNLSTLPKNYFVFNDLFNNETFLLYESKKYGLSFKDDNHVYLSNYIEYKNDKYYLFVNKKSIHSLNFSVQGVTDFVYKVIEGFINV